MGGAEERPWVRSGGDYKPRMTHRLNSPDGEGAVPGCATVRPPLTGAGAAGTIRALPLPLLLPLPG